MKIHWGTCPAKAIEEEYIGYNEKLQKEKSALIIKLDAQLAYEKKLLKQNDEALRKIEALQTDVDYKINKMKSTLEDEYNRVLRKDADYVSGLLVQNDEFAAKIKSYQSKIKHLEQVIDDYNKVSLMEKTPAYIEIVPVPESEKPKRKQKCST
jgi:hypothetical protein